MNSVSKGWFLEQMEENVSFNLMFPYHVDFENLSGNHYYNKDFPDSYHTHNFVDLLNVVYNEPMAFYLTEEDKVYYSQQELDFIERVKICEMAKARKGFEVFEMKLSEDTMEQLKELKNAWNMTYEQVITGMLKKLVETSGECLKED